MYFPSDEEQRLVQRLLADARSEGIADELRGWSWQRAPVRPVFDTPLAVYEVAGKYCPSGRDVYLRRVLGLRAAPNRAMQAGAAVHALVASLFTAAKRLVYQHGSACVEPLEELRLHPLPTDHLDRLPPEHRPALLRTLEAVRAFQARRIVGRVEEALARQPQAGPDAIAALALPAAVELRLDGSLLGLSPHLASDAVLFAGAAVAELKLGSPEPWHRLATTGYALTLESLYDRPVDLGCIVYLEVKEGRLSVRRDFHIIGDELRQWFLQEREEKMRLVSEELDPGLPDRCPSACPWVPTCRPTTIEEETAAPAVVAANLAPIPVLNGATES